MKGKMNDVGENKRLNWRQACEILGCGKNLFYRLIRSGRLPAYRTQGSERGLWVYESDCHSLVQRINVSHHLNEAKP